MTWKNRSFALWSWWTGKSRCWKQSFGKSPSTTWWQNFLVVVSNTADVKEEIYSKVLWLLYIIKSRICNFSEDSVTTYLASIKMMCWL